MAVRIIWSRIAVRDLEEVRAYIARDNPSAARIFVQGLRRKLSRLKEFPQLGRSVPESRDPDKGELLFGPYRIVYGFASGSQSLTIFRIWHAARGEPEL